MKHKFNPKMMRMISMKYAFISQNVNTKTNIFAKKHKIVKIFAYLCISTGFYYTYSSDENTLAQDFSTDQIKTFINQILTSSEIKEGGITFLDHVFKDKNSKSNVSAHFKMLLKEDNMKAQSHKSGVNLFNQILSDQVIKSKCKEVFVNLLKEEEIRYKGVTMLKYIFAQKQSFDQMSDYLRIIFKRSDIDKALINVISDSALYTFNRPETKEKFKHFFLEVWADPNLRWFVIKKSFNIWENTGQNVIISKSLV